MYELYYTFDKTYQMIYGVKDSDTVGTMFLIFYEDEWKWIPDYWFKPSHF